MPKLIVLTSPECSGKSTIGKLVLNDMPEIERFVTHTTRKPREGEQDGVDYHFVTLDEFHSMESAGRFVETNELIPGVFYGTSKQEFYNHERAKAVMLILDVNGAGKWKGLHGDNCLLIFIKAPSIEEVKRRYALRAQNTPEEIEARLKLIEKELAFESEADVTVINDDLEVAVQETEDAIKVFLSTAK